jgi:prevent-host-death family protein
METLNATEAKREFGDLLIRAQHEPIGINKNGKPIAVIVSAQEYNEIEEYKEYLLKRELQKGLDDYHNGRVRSGRDVFDDLRKRRK